MARPLIGCLVCCSFAAFATAQVPAQQTQAQREIQAQRGGVAQGNYPVRAASDNRPLSPPAVAAQAGPANVRADAQAVLPLMPQQPEWVALLTAEELKWIDDVLMFWEQRSSDVKLFSCEFQRWDYDGGWVDSTGKRHPRTYAKGTIKYAQPDKGLYQVKTLVSIMPPAEGATKPQEVVQNPDLGEHWVCDGEQIFSFEASKKQVTVNPLPPNMRGQAIADGPLPFMFGAKAQTIKARYWIRGLAAAPGDKSKENKYWLEAIPKSRQDAQNFKMVRIVLDKEKYLPESIEIFAPNYDPPRNDARQSYFFSDRVDQDKNAIAAMVAKGLDPLGLIHRDFYEPRIPTGWKKVVQNPEGNVAAPPPQQANQGPGPRLPQTAIPR